MNDSPSVEAQLAVINTKLDLLLVQRDDHEARIRSLEAVVDTPQEKQRKENDIDSLLRFKWALGGFVLAGGGAAGAVVSKLLG